MGPITAGRSLNLSNRIFLSAFRQLTNSILQFMDTGNFPVFAYVRRGGIFKLLKPRNRFQRKYSASLICSPAVRYDNSIPSRFLAPIDCSKFHH
jgi:hypothetical protein